MSVQTNIDHFLVASPHTTHNSNHPPPPLQHGPTRALSIVTSASASRCPVPTNNTILFRKSCINRQTKLAVMSYNINGVNDSKLTAIKQNIDKLGLMAVAFQETKEQNTENRSYVSKISTDDRFIVLKCNTAHKNAAKHGVAIMIRRDKIKPDSVPTVLYRCNNGRTLIVQFLDEFENNVVLASLYFPAGSVKERIEYMRDLPWNMLAGAIICCDSNLITNTREHHSNKHRDQIRQIGDDGQAFIEFLQRHNLVDLFNVFYDDDEHPTTRFGKGGARDATLDRIVVPADLVPFVFKCETTDLSMSDHEQVIAGFYNKTRTSNRPKRQPPMKADCLKKKKNLIDFKQKVLKQHDDFYRANVNPAACFNILMEDIRAFLESRHRESKKSKRRKMRTNLLERLRQTKRLMEKSKTGRERARHRRRFVKQRKELDNFDEFAKEREFLQNEKKRFAQLISSKTVFSYRNKNNQSNTIPCVLDANDRQHDSDTFIAKTMSDYFAGQFRDENVDVDRSDALQKVLQSVPNKTEKVANINCDISIDDLEAALNVAKIGSAPGRDGITNALFVHAPVLLNDLLRVWQQRHVFGVPDSFKQVLFSPIHKRGDKRIVSNYRPIGLQSVCRKLITKAIHVRLGRVMPEIINPEQTAFVENRTINDGLAKLLGAAQIANDEMFPQPLAILSYDFARAYDTIRHDYVLAVLEKLGFNDAFRKDIAFLLADQSGTVVVNGRLTSQFPLQTGLIQGDPLSCSLYVLCVSPLAKLAKAFGAVGFNADPNGDIAPILCSQYVDDLEAFVTSVRDIHAWNKALDVFGKASGNVVNKDKSYATIGNNYDDRFDVLPSPFNTANKIVRGNDFIRKLGFYFDANGGIHTSAWSRALTHARAAATRWKYARIDMELRAQVIVTDILAAALYLAFIIPCPDKIADQFDAIVFDFLANGRRARPRRELLSNQRSIGGVLKNGIGQMRDLCAGRLASFYARSMLANKSTPNAVLQNAERQHALAVDSRRQHPQLTVAPPGKQPLIGVPRATNSSVFNPYTVAKRTFASLMPAVKHSDVLSRPRLMPTDYILTQRIYNNPLIDVNLTMLPSVSKNKRKRDRHRLRLADMLDKKLNIVASMQNSSAGKAVDAAMKRFGWFETLRAKKPLSEQELSVGTLVVLRNGSAMIDRCAVNVVVGWTPNGKHVKLRDIGRHLGQSLLINPMLLATEPNARLPTAHSPLKCIRAYVTADHTIRPDCDRNCDIENIHFVRDPPLLELAITGKLDDVVRQPSVVQAKHPRLEAQRAKQLARNRLEAIAYPRITAQQLNVSEKLIAMRQHVGVGSKTLTKVLVQRSRSINRQRFSVPNIRSAAVGANNDHFSFDDWHALKVKGSLKDWTYYLLHNKLYFGSTMTNMRQCPTCGLAIDQLPNDHATRDCAFAMSVRDRCAQHFHQLASNVSTAVFNKAWTMNFRITPKWRESHALAVFVLVAKKELYSECLRRHSSNGASSSSVDFVYQCARNQFRKHAKDFKRLIESQLRKIPSASKQEACKLRNFCAHPWFVVLPDPSADAWPD
jgi:exonuclease III